MAFSPSNSLRQQTQLYSVTLCKCPWTLNPFNFHFPSSFFTFSPPKHPPQPSFSPLLVVRAHVTDQEISNNTMNHATSEQSVSGLPYFKANYKRVGNKYVKKIVRKDGDTGQRVDSRIRRELDSGFSSVRSKDENLVKKSIETDGNSSSAINRKKGNKDIKGCDKQLGVEEKMRKGAKKSKVDSSGVKFRVGLDMCSKRGDVMGALKLYDSAWREGITMGQYHYTVLLYLCSSAATGIVHPAKSGTHGRSLSIVATRPTTSEVSTVKDEVSEISGGIEVDSSGFTTEVGKDNLDITFNGENLAQDNNGVAKPSPQVIDGKVDLGSEDSDFRNKKDSIKPETYEIRVSGDLMKYALRRGFEIYERMCLEKVPMNEASLTSVARMALAMGDGDMAFDTVKQMKVLGINPRLRSYGPALSAFCSCGDIDKAFAVEEHMLEHGVYPEEPELEALLRVSIEVGRSDKVYYVLHKLRTSVRKVLPSTADLIEKWFKSKVASKVGKRKLDQSLIREAIENGGGGWHGHGWLGKGKWNVSRTFVGADGLCKCCGEKLATIDLDPKETERFAESVASIATQKEKTSFQKFRKWLDCYGPFEAVVDGANIGLFKERMFRPSKVNAVVNEIRKLLPSRKWPLIVVHNRRITGSNTAKPVNKALIEEWKAADALYATPTGSNDDWYWLYAAIKFKCLIVTNDEMRDHLFQLLGNDFFPKWKERHQVRFNFSDTGLLIHMPPPYSVVIQESERGYWHIPIVSEHDDERQRTWLCIKRANSPGAKQVTPTMHEESLFPLHKKVRASSDTPTKTEAKLTPLNQGKHINTRTLNTHLKKVTGI